MDSGSEKPAKSPVYFYNRFYWPDESATAQILVDLAKHMASQGWEVHVVTSRLRYENVPGDPLLEREEEREGVKIHRLRSTSFGRASLPGRLMDYLSIYVSFFVHLLTKPSGDDIVVLKTDPPLLSVLGWLVRQLRSFKMVAWCQDLFPEVAEHALGSNAVMGPLYSVLKVLRNHSLNGCDTVAVLSGDMKTYLRKIGINSHIAILPNWAIQRPSDQGISHKEMREEWGLSDRIVLGYSGNLGRAHDTDTFLEALPALQKLKMLTTLFIGGGARYVQVKEQVQSYPESFCRFLPYQPRGILDESLKVPHIHWFSLEPAMASHVYPSKFYGIMRSGRPMIFVGDPSSELGSIIHETKCGFVVSPGDVVGFYQAVEKLYSDPLLRKTFGENAEKLDAEAFSRRSKLIQWEDAISRTTTINDT